MLLVLFLEVCVEHAVTAVDDLLSADRSLLPSPNTRARVVAMRFSAEAVGPVGARTSLTSGTRDTAGAIDGL